MINVGIIGVGGISGVHIPNYIEHSNTRIVALCDIIPERAQGKTQTAINIGTAQETVVEAKAYLDYHDLLKDDEVELVDICLPTYLHAEAAIAALEAGKHVLSEKPMALNVAECDRMIAAAKANDRILMIAHCIRFWPEYVVLKELIDGGQYGKLVSAVFRRLSGTPAWGAANNWFLDPSLSGGSILDLHIHDVDYITYLLGMPTAVTSKGVTDTNGISYVISAYSYNDVPLVVAEGGWIHPPTYPFQMVFTIHLEMATVEWTGACPLTVYPKLGDVFTPEVPAGDGYRHEIRYLIDCIEQGKKPSAITPWGARETIRLIHAEIASVQSGQPVVL